MEGLPPDREEARTMTHGRSKRRFTTCPGASPVVLRGDELLDLDRLSRLLVVELLACPPEGRLGPTDTTEGVRLGLWVVEERLMLLCGRVDRDSDGTLGSGAALDGPCGQEQLERGVKDSARRTSRVHGLHVLAAERELTGLHGLRSARVHELLSLAVLAVVLAVLVGLPGQLEQSLTTMGLGERAEATADDVWRLVHGSFSLPLARTTGRVHWMKERNLSYF